MKKKEKLFDLKYPPNTNKRIDSLGGNIYLYLRQYLFYKKSQIYLKKFKDALQTNLNIINNSKKK